MKDTIPINLNSNTKQKTSNTTSKLKKSIVIIISNTLLYFLLKNFTVDIIVTIKSTKQNIVGNAEISSNAIIPLIESGLLVPAPSNNNVPFKTSPNDNIAIAGIKYKIDLTSLKIIKKFSIFFYFTICINFHIFSSL